MKSALDCGVALMTLSLWSIQGRSENRSRVVGAGRAMSGGAGVCRESSGSEESRDAFAFP